MKQVQQESGLLKVSEVARRLRVNDTTVRRWVKTGAMKAVALPGRRKRCIYRVPASELRKMGVDA